MVSSVRVPPDDEHNQALVANVHPADWVNPKPSGRYNLVVIGAGTGGLITALIASSLGAKVALIERHLMGGDCLNVGCVPSKAIIHAARSAHSARAAARFGIGAAADAQPDFGSAMRFMRKVRARISHEDSAERYSNEFGIDVYLGEAAFVREGRVRVDGQELEYKKAVIATGARAIAPPIPGLAEAGYLDNESVFELTERPASLAVIGAGPIGCELAQSFARLGSQVSLLEVAPQILIREDPDAAALIQQALEEDGIETLCGCQIQRVEAKGERRLLHLKTASGAERALEVEAILVGAGRAPNVEGIGLDRVGVEFDPRTGVRVDDRLCTTNPSIYAVGDVCMQWKFTHAADAAAKLVVQNALFSFGLPLLQGKLSSLIMPWCTYTDPEIAHVGMYERDAREQGVEIDTYEVGMDQTNRALTDDAERGFVKVHVKRGTDQIVGATIVSEHAGELISQFTIAIQKKIGLGSFTSVIYPYPTQAEAIKRAAGAYTRTRLTESRKKLLAMVMRLLR